MRPSGEAKAASNTRALRPRIASSASSSVRRAASLKGAGTCGVVWDAGFEEVEPELGGSGSGDQAAACTVENGGRA